MSASDPAAATADAAAKDNPPAAASTDSAKGDTKGSSTGGDNSPAEAPPPKADVLSLIEAFQSPYPVQVFAGTEKFRKLPADARRNVLAELSAHENPTIRNNAWRSFATWATRDDVPTLIAALQSPHEDVRTAALDLIARLPNRETIGVLTKVLENPDSRERAEALLMRVGPAAEEPLLAYVSHADPGLRQSAWRVLGQIGSRKSLLALEQAATQAELQKDAELKDALEKVRERLRK